MIAGPVLPRDGVYVTGHVPRESVQLTAENVPDPSLTTKSTEPVGVLVVPEEVSVTVAVQVTATSTSVAPSPHTTDVPVARCVTSRLVVLFDDE